MGNRFKQSLYLVPRGTLLGLLLGSGLSIFYLLISSCIVTLTFGLENAKAFLQAGFGYGVLPSIFMGAIGGLLISLAIASSTRDLSAAKDTGYVVTGFFGLYWLLIIMYSFLIFSGYVPYVILAFAVSLGAGGWFGQKIYLMKLGQAQSAEISLDQEPKSLLRSIAGPLRVFVWFALIIFIVDMGVRISRQSEGTVIESYTMQWSNDTSFPSCSSYVVLEFVSSPGYIITACSAELLGSLQSNHVNPVEVQFSRSYVNGAWNYKIEKVGSWNGAAQFDGLMLSCSSDDANCGQTKSPIREPYLIK